MTASSDPEIDTGSPPSLRTLDAGDSATAPPASDPAPANVTIGIPAYNNGATMARTIRSIQAQTFRAWRLLISDDGSGDDTVTVCERIAAGDGRIRVVRQPTNLMYMNFGFLVRSAETPYFVWLAGDDYWHPAFLESCVSLLEAHPEAVSAVPRCEFAEGARLVARPADTATISGAPVARALAFLAEPNGSRMYGVFRTEALRRAFPTRNMFAYDFALMLAVLRHGPQLGIDRVLLTRSATPWQEYARSVRQLYDRRLFRAFPLLDMTLYALRRRLIPARPSVLARLLRLNAEKHEEYVFVNKPWLFLRLNRGYRALGLPKASATQPLLGAARDLLADENPARRGLAERVLERRGAAGTGAADMILGRYRKERGPFPWGHLEAARHYARAARNEVRDAGFLLLVTEMEAGRLASDAPAPLFLRAAHEGSPAAAVELARLVYSGRAGDIDFAAVHRTLDARRSQAHPAVLRALALLAERGLGRPRDRPEALALLVLAAEREPRAAREVGRLVLEEGAPGAAGEAEYWYRRAAGTGDAWSLRDLAELVFARGQRGEALDLCLRAAGASTSPELTRGLEALLARVRDGAGWLEAPPEAGVPDDGGVASSRPSSRSAPGAMVERSVGEHADMRDIVVWGAHRSGTSVLTESLETMGWCLGQANRTATVENPRGFFENNTLVELNDRLLREIGASWSNWAMNYPALRFDYPRFDPFRRVARALLDALDAEAGAGAWALKDPRMSALSAFWAPMLAERSPPPRHLLLLRDPREAAASQLARALADPAAHRLLHRPDAILVLWASSLASALRALADQEILVVAHGALEADPTDTLRRIARFADGADTMADAAASRYEARYHRSRADQVDCTGPWVEMTDRLFLALHKWAGSVLAPSDTAEILVSAGEIERALEYLGPFAGLLAALDRGETEWFAYGHA